MRPAGPFNHISYTTGPAGVYIRFHRIPFVFTLQDTVFRFPDEDAGYPVISENTENALCSFLPGTQGVFSGLLLYSFASYDECFSSSVLRRLMNVSVLRRSDAQELRPESDFLFRSASAKPLSVTDRHVFTDDPLDMGTALSTPVVPEVQNGTTSKQSALSAFASSAALPFNSTGRRVNLNAALLYFADPCCIMMQKLKTNFFRRYSIWNWERK